jgi:hypothetical protein
MNMAALNEWLIAFGLLVVLSLLSRPGIQRVLMPLAKRVSLWATARHERTEEWDPDEAELWLVEKRRRLSADLRRIERLLATDSWMSATRQLGNRLAYRQLVEDLRDIPEVLPSALAPFQAFNSWDDSADLLESARYIRSGYANGSPQIEILEIGWGRRRH